MSSYKRIPGSAIKRSESKVAMNDQFAVDEEVFKKTTVEQYVDHSKKKIELEEEKMLHAIEEQKQQLIQQAKEEGEKQALIEAKEIVKKEYETILNEANEIYEKANVHYKNVIEQTEEIKTQFMKEKQEEIIDFFLLSIQTIIHQEVQKEKVDIEKIYDEMMAKIKYDTKKIYIRVHPKTQHLLAHYKNVERDSRVEFLYDLTLGEADFIVETEREFIDFSLETQLENMRVYLRGVLNDRSE